MRTFRRRAPATFKAVGLVRRFIREDGGQDLVEYAFLAAFVGITGYLALNGISSAILSTYTSWMNPSSGVPSLWEPPAPS
jgi:Flp pilus assembly pilin Flp